MEKLGKQVTNEEIKHVLFCMSHWKTSGPDGFLTGFYQRACHIVGKKVCDYIKRVWNIPSEIATINQIVICVISMTNHHECVNHFMSISLCSVLYKVVNKVLVERLKESIPNLISPFHSGFVSGMSIHENIIVA